MDAPDTPTLHSSDPPRTSVAVIAARAHAQKNCLTVIESLVALLARAPLGERERGLVTVLRDASARLHDLVLDDLASAFPSALPAQEVDLAEVVRGVCDRLTPVATERGAHLTLQLAPCVILGHHASLDEAITNVVLNAIQASFPDGNILVNLRREGDRACCSVLDEGQGITESSDGSRPSKPGGTGLGLAITREIAEQHNGLLLVAPREGGGASVALWLPLSPP